MPQVALPWFISAQTQDMHWHVFRFDSESLPLLREKICDLVNEGVMDFDAGQWLFINACRMVSGGEVE